MSKQNLDKIFNKGSKFKLREIDLNDPEFEEMTKAVEDEKFNTRNKKKSNRYRGHYGSQGDQSDD